MASRSWNRVELMGNLTRDPELRYTPNGAAVCTFGVATNRSYVTDGERREDVDFHQIVAWNKLAELCSQLLKKGSRVFVSGRLQYREWEGQDSQKRRVAEIVVEDMIQVTPRGQSTGEFTDSEVAEAFSAGESTKSSETPSSKAKTSAQATDGSNAGTPTATETVNEDDLPF